LLLMLFLSQKSVFARGWLKGGLTVNSVLLIPDKRRSILFLCALVL
jgi:hypothetical protein